MATRYSSLCAGLIFCFPAMAGAQVLPKNPTLAEQVSFRQQELQIWKLKQLQPNSALYQFQFMQVQSKGQALPTEGWPMRIQNPFLENEMVGGSNFKSIYPGKTYRPWLKQGWRDQLQSFKHPLMQPKNKYNGNLPTKF